MLCDPCEAWDRPWWGKFFGIAVVNIAIAAVPAGTLIANFVNRNPILPDPFTYLSKKTHLHVVKLLMIPPNNGPSKRAIARTPDTKLVYPANFSGGTNSKKITTTREYVPEPPKPWKARNTILSYRQCSTSIGFDSRGHLQLGHCLCRTAGT